jgi:hypothetical protein
LRRGREKSNFANGLEKVAAAFPNLRLLHIGSCDTIGPEEKDLLATKAILPAAILCCDLRS